MTLNYFKKEVFLSPMQIKLILNNKICTIKTLKKECFHLADNYKKLLFKNKIPMKNLDLDYNKTCL